MRRSVAVLGATGSIGTQALDILRRYPDRFYTSCVTARGGAQKLFDIVREFRPRVAALDIEPESVPDDLRFCEWVFGEGSSARALKLARADDALCAISGVAGLSAAWTALDECGRVLLANKEALVTGGDMVMEKSRALGKPIIPVDSEHSAIYQCLRARDGNAVKRLIITASGGALRGWDKAELGKATPEDVLRHPTWNMGAKITVDCATMLNKGFEVIETRHLFDMPPGKISVLMHPQSVVHSMVEFEDGAVMAQLGAPDMRGPIGYALGFPERLPYGGEPLNLAKIGALTFAEPDVSRYPCFKLALGALEAGQSACVALNAASEVAVSGFLGGKTGYNDIARIIETVLGRIGNRKMANIEDVYAQDALARELAAKAIGG